MTGNMHQGHASEAEAFIYNTHPHWMRVGVKIVTISSAHVPENKLAPCQKTPSGKEIKNLIQLRWEASRTLEILLLLPVTSGESLRYGTSTNIYSRQELSFFGFH